MKKDCGSLFTFQSYILLRCNAINRPFIMENNYLKSLSPNDPNVAGLK